MLHAVVSVHRTVVKESNVHVYCNCASVQFSQILSKSGLDQKSYSANKKGVKFFETQCSYNYLAFSLTKALVLVFVHKTTRKAQSNEWRQLSRHSIHGQQVATKQKHWRIGDVALLLTVVADSAALSSSL